MFEPRRREDAEILNKVVIPAKAGTYTEYNSSRMDPGLRRDDGGIMFFAPSVPPR